MSETPWEQFLGLLHQIKSLEDDGASGVALDVVVQEARALRPELPGWVTDVARAYPPGLFELAHRRVFERAPIRTEEIEPISIEDDPATPPPFVARGIELQKIAAAIAAAITEAGGVGDVSVAYSATHMTLGGIAVDDDARDNAQIIAAKLAPGVEIKNSITVV
jgi:hypothetical protein